MITYNQQRLHRGFWRGMAALCLAATLATPAQSQDADTLDAMRQALRIEIPTSNALEALTATNTSIIPGSTISTPTGFGIGWGRFYGGVGYQDRVRYDDWRDGIFVLGMGLGDPFRYVGLELTLSILDTYDDFLEDKALSVKLHRRLPASTSVAIGWENIWHTDGTDGGSSAYAVASKFFVFRDNPDAPFGSAIVSIGIGNDRFLPEKQFMRRADGVNGFGSVGLRLARPVNAVANWTGQDLNVGLSIVPIRSMALAITPSFLDVTGRAGDGARFAVAVGLVTTLF
ncbi:MAG: hypothetical protein AAF970_00475 [Bacteroidota bacterium]